MITVKEMKEILAKLPPEADNWKLILSSDGEGNDFSPLAGWDIGTYVPETNYCGEVVFEHDREPEDEDKDNCIVLWPTN